MIHYLPYTIGGETSFEDALRIGPTDAVVPVLGEPSLPAMARSLGPGVHPDTTMWIPFAAGSGDVLGICTVPGARGLLTQPGSRPVP